MRSTGGRLTGSRLPPYGRRGSVSLPGPGADLRARAAAGEAMCDAGAFAISLALGGAISGFPSSTRAESDGVRFRVTFS